MAFALSAQKIAQNNNHLLTLTIPKPVGAQTSKTPTGAQLPRRRSDIVPSEGTTVLERLIHHEMQ